MSTKPKSNGLILDAKKQIIAVIISASIFGFISLYTSVIQLKTEIIYVKQKLDRLESFFLKTTNL